MHIPSCPTQALEVVPFDAALAQALEPAPSMTLQNGYTSPITTGSIVISWAPGGSTP